MYVVDVTRCNNTIENDMLVGKDSMDAKSKTMKYIMDYSLVNCEVSIDKEVLDQNLNVVPFSLKQFLIDNYSLSVEQDLIIQTINTDIDNCIFLKYQDESMTYPAIYKFNKKDKKQAQALMTYLVNETLLDKYQDNLDKYDKIKIKKEDKNNINYTLYSKENIRSEIISLYNEKGKFIDELIKTDCSLNDINVNINIRNTVINNY